MGTQTSKPLFGDEERKNRFRRPRTPTNVASSTDSSTNSHESGDKRTWPCANCHATVSNEESRCPYCGGIQVKVRIPQSPLSNAKAINSDLLLQRLSTPTTPITPVIRKEIHASRLQAFLSESATTSTMDYDEEEEEMYDHGPAGDDMNRPASALSQSSLSQSFNIPIHLQQQLPVPPFSSSPVPLSDRPPDPVALTLETAQVSSGAPSPQVPLEKPQPQHTPKRKAASSGFEMPKKKLASSP